MSSKHHSKTKKEAASAPKAEAKPTAPAIVDPTIQPSQVSINSVDQPVIDYKRFVKSQKEAIENDSLEALGLFQESPALVAGRVVLEVIDNPSFDEMAASSSPAVTDFLQFLRTKVPNKAMNTIATTYLPCIPKPHLYMEAFVHLLLRMANESSDPTKFMRWLCMNFPPTKWAKKQTSTNTKLLAMGLCSVENHGNKALWIALDNDSIIHVYKQVGEEIEAIIEEKCTRFNVEDKKVAAYGISGDVLLRFIPIDSKLTQAWAVSFDKKHASFPMFMTSFDKAIPPLIMKAYNDAITAHDGHMVRAFLGKDVCNNHPMLAKSLLTLFMHDQSVHTLLATIIGSSFAKPKIDITFLLSSVPFIPHLYKAFIQRFATNYVTDFLRKLIVYIDSSDDLNIEKMDMVNAEKAEKVFFTSLKYIMDTSSLFSNEIRHLVSYIRYFSAIRFNKMSFTYFNIADFIGIRFICGVLENPTQYIPDLTLSKPDNVCGICRLLRIAFKLGQMCGPYEKFASWNNRLNNHVYPKLMHFMYSIGDMGKREPKYEIPSDQEFAEALNFLMKELAEKHKPFMKELDLIKKSSIPYPGLLGFNFATALCRYFEHFYDNAVVEEPKHEEEKKEEHEEQKDEEYSYSSSESEKKEKEDEKEEEKHDENVENHEEEKKEEENHDSEKKEEEKNEEEKNDEAEEKKEDNVKSENDI
ncbi:hypothetical protein TVAG_113670 [Trichomonas vaginalis G3]|uniref:Ras-GAP domain-containing protein n=1 Tax=Trichomonas vaginalis (strain ATCC PRA-98 / G3) TaxID=412133 RepID=A2DNM0_TRIV3|nr:GTPase activation domain, GAP family [Trichomonas vaginalis G3]EAY18023.1 hypothetical protein TVAG_113670 [Trichomonas vaginalis G3]KAI5524419.1 GTPase activation domain, GAP family [Trichomonas vaginalis G3]|eukprot:XP_001579009.1 hypothetical protein [Trichomonas vaginalis G3]